MLNEIPTSHTLQPWVDRSLGFYLHEPTQIELAPFGTGHVLVRLTIEPCSVDTRLGNLTMTAPARFTGGWWARYTDGGDLVACAPIGDPHIRATFHVFLPGDTSEPRRAWEARFNGPDSPYSLVARIACPKCRAVNAADQWGGYVLDLDERACPACGHTIPTGELRP